VRTDICLDRAKPHDQILVAKAQAFLRAMPTLQLFGVLANKGYLTLEPIKLFKLKGCVRCLRDCRCKHPE